MRKLKILFLVYICAVLVVNLGGAILQSVYKMARYPIPPESDLVNVYFPPERRADTRFTHYVKNYFDDESPRKEMAVEVWIDASYRDRGLKKIAGINLLLLVCFIIAVRVIRTNLKKA